MLAVLLQWDYGRKSRGESLENICFLPAISALVEKVDVFWYDDLLDNSQLLQNRLKDRICTIRPDLVFFLPLSEEFPPEFVKEISSKVPTFCWFGDDQWRFDSYTFRYAHCFSHVSTTDPRSIKKYNAIGIDPILTQWAAHRLSSDTTPLRYDRQYRYDVSFIGGANRYRKWFIDFLAASGVTVECFGSGWSNGRVDFIEMEDIFRTSRINLNLSNSVNHDLRFVFGGLANVVSFLRSPKRVEQMKARNFEIPLAGGFELTNFVPGLDFYFRIGEEIGIYSTPDDCVSQIRYYLDATERREQIAWAGYVRAMNEHTYEHRLQAIFSRIWDPSKEL